MTGKVRILIGGGGVPHDGLCAGVALGFAIAVILEHVVSLVQSMRVLLEVLSEECQNQ